MDTCYRESVFIRLFTVYILFTYSISDPALNFECADQPWNATTGAPVIQCTAGYCVTKVVYQRDRKAILSMDRGCRMPEPVNCGQNCCWENSHNFVCQYQCRGTTSGESACNSRDVSRAPKDDTGETTCNSRDVSRAPKDDTGGTATDIKISSILTFLIILVGNVIF